MLKGAGRFRDYALFVLGINFGLRIDDLLYLKVKNVIDESGLLKERFTITEGKTKKRNTIKINDGAREALELLFFNTNIKSNPENPLIYRFGTEPAPTVWSFYNHQQNLFRLLASPSSITGERKYIEAAYDATAFMFERYQDKESGLFYWGGHRGYMWGISLSMSPGT